MMLKRLLTPPFVLFTILMQSAFLTTACTGGNGDVFDREEAAPAERLTDPSLAFMAKEEASAFSGYDSMGEYRGKMYIGQEQDSQDSVYVGLQVAVYGPDRFRGVLYKGGLPGEGDGPVQAEQIIELEGDSYEGAIRLQPVDSDEKIRVQKIHGAFTILDESRNYLGHLDRIERRSPVSGLSAPDGAVQLFTGREADLEHWDGETRMDGDYLMQGATSTALYGDFRLHLEAKLGFMPNAPDQQRTNSGIYIQNRYEVQILDSFALPVAINGNGSLYNEVAPGENMTFPPLQWQTYDVWFRAPRFDGEGQKVENARVTVYLNGVRVIDDAVLERGTGRGGEREEVSEAEVYLQDHTGPVRFRNVWVLEERYDPPGERYLSGSDFVPDKESGGQ